MAKIHRISIKNFRCFKTFEHSFNGAPFICLIGRGDSGKSTLLNAINCALSYRWNLAFYDSDFYNCETENPIEIEITLTDLPTQLINEHKYGLHIRGIDKTSGAIEDELEDEHEKALTIKLEVHKDLEPNWFVINSRQENPVPISGYDRAMFCVFFVSDFLDRHFSWNKGNPLYSLLRQQKEDEEVKGANIILDALRKAKDAIDEEPFSNLKDITDTIKNTAEGLGIDISKASTTIDFRDLSISDDKVCLHDDKIPFRLRGKGAKRLVSIAIQMALAKKGGIILIDEVEQGLEPDRTKHLVHALERDVKGQIFIATHSQNVIEELEAKNIFKVDNATEPSKLIECDETFQAIFRACPEAAYADKVIVCEGKTEIGICRALDKYRKKSGQANLAAKNTIYTLGDGSNFAIRAAKLKELNLKTCVFCDSDRDPDLNPSKDALRGKSISIFDWESGNAIEHQVFKELPWEAIMEIIEYRVQCLNNDEVSVKESIAGNYTGSFPRDWKDNDTPELRTALAKTSILKIKRGDKKEDKSWFKRIDHGEFLGQVIFKSYGKIDGTKLKSTLDSLSQWVDNGE